jgi:hypothetical protein
MISNLVLVKLIEKINPADQFQLKYVLGRRSLLTPSQKLSRLAIRESNYSIFGNVAVYPLQRGSRRF